jgi:uncharacterized protein (UPF0332 family)
VIDELRADISKYRLALSRDCLVAAFNNIKSGDFKASANRAYYCIFNAMRAVLALDKLDFKKHSGVISEFQRLYIKTKRFPVEFSVIIENAFIIRGKSDYEDFYVISKDEVVRQAESAKTFFEAVERYLSSL